MIELDQIPFRPTRHPGVSIHFYSSDRATGRAAVMIRMAPGCSYPRHRHTGAEELLVLQGGFRDDSGRAWRAGDFARFEPGSAHHPVALDGDEDCVFFAIAHEGIELFDAPDT
ncbi:MAG: cupin domain-containing protein [Planctomycetes bacterium]|nr:cupin domain-containing protein [Planctomycetota bacterium]